MEYLSICLYHLWFLSPVSYSFLYISLLFRWKVKVKSLSHIQLFVTVWTVAYQAPPSMGFSRKDIGVGCHFFLQGIFLTQGLNTSLDISGRFLLLSYQGSPRLVLDDVNIPTNKIQALPTHVRHMLLHFNSWLFHFPFPRARSIRQEGKMRAWESILHKFFLLRLWADIHFLVSEGGTSN